MSDELMIQPQIQPQRVSTTPYLLGGAALGAAAGYGGTLLKKGGEAKSYEELIKSANDADKVELTAKKEAVEKAEKELAEAGKAVYEGTEKEALDKAVQAREDAFNKLVNEKKAALEASNGGIDSNKFKLFNQINSSDLPTEDINGKPFRGNQCEQAYSRLTDAVKKAESRVDASLASGVGGERSRLATALKTYNDMQYSTYGSKSIDEIAEIFGKRTKTVGVFPFKTERITRQYESALREAIKEYPEFNNTSLKPEHYLEFGQEADPKTAVQKGYTRKGVNLIDPKTQRPSAHTTYVDYKVADLNNFIAEQEKLVAEKRTAYADQLFANAHESVLLQKQKATLLHDFGSNVEKGLATQTGLYNDVSNVLNMSEIIGGSKRTTLKVGTGKKSKIGYAADIQVLKDEIKAAKKAGRAAVMPSVLNGVYTGVTDVEKALDMAHARNSVSNSYVNELKNIENRIEKLVTNNSVIEELDAKIAEIKANDKGLQKAKEKLAEQFPKLFGENTSGLTAEQIETQAREYAEKNIGKSYQSKIDNLKEVYEKALAEKGKINEGAKKAAEDTVAKAKGELDKLVSDLGGKVGGMSGKMKAAIIGGTAVVGALIGSSMANSKNKKFEAEAAQNLYA